jgi:hypothetical protein
MRLKIVQIWDRGVANKERLDLLVIAPANLNYYSINDTVRMANGNIVAVPKRSYWFTAAQVNPGDHVILYTGPGTNRTVIRTDGRTNHFFFWGLPSTIWHGTDSCAVLIEMASWETST